MADSSRNDQISQGVIDAIGALGNRHRLQILVALAMGAEELQHREAELPFTELHDAVDVKSSSQFAYHLDQLTGRFVSETPNGYRLTYSGHKIVRTILSGSYESSSAFEERPIEGVCVFCEASSLLATLEDERFVVRCDGCESVLLTNDLPRSQARGRSPEQIVASFGYRIWGEYVHLRGSVCPECFGPVNTRIESHERGDKTLYTHASTCRECRFMLHMPVEVATAFHPVVIHDLWTHGISLLDVPLWQFFEFITSGDITTKQVSDDPIELSCTISFGDEPLSFAIDNTVAVAPADRS